jgi:uncharacterized protein YxjI
MTFEADEFVISQKKEWAELFGFETRNAYAIVINRDQVVGTVREQGSGFFAMVARQLLGHWRRFELILTDNEGQIKARIFHPFRFLFQRLEVTSADGRWLGTVQQRFGFLRRRFELQLPTQAQVWEMSSPIWKVWTFPIRRQEQMVATIEKKWSGLLKEAFTDADNFRLVVSDPTLTQDEKITLIAASVFVDLQYFEKKGGS